MMCDNKLQKGGERHGQFPSGTLVWHLDKKESFSENSREITASLSSRMVSFGIFKDEACDFAV
jgi:hypothetical protein